MPSDPERRAHPDRRAAGELEAQVLGVLWAAGNRISVGEILPHLDGDMAYTTVAKVLDRLYAKGQVRRTRSGRSYEYAPVAIESNWVAGQVRRLLGRAGNRAAVLQGFVDGLDPADAKILVDLLQTAQQHTARTNRGTKA